MKYSKFLKINDYVFFLANAFGIGVIISTGNSDTFQLILGFIHMFPEATELLSHECLPLFFTEGYGATAGLIAMFSALVVHLIQTWAITHYKARSFGPAELEKSNFKAQDDQNQSEQDVVIPVHDHNALTDKVVAEAKQEKQITTILLEGGVAAHSVLIGIALGVSTGSNAVALLIAISFHQFFEGLALSTTALTSSFDTLFYPIIFACIYSIVTPTGIAIGMIMAQTFQENSVEALITQGVFDAISAGILIYDGLVNLLTMQITKNSEFHQYAFGKKALIFISLWFGAACMAIIGIWA